MNIPCTARCVSLRLRTVKAVVYLRTRRPLACRGPCHILPEQQQSTGPEHPKENVSAPFRPTQNDGRSPLAITSSGYCIVKTTTASIWGIVNALDQDVTNFNWLKLSDGIMISALSRMLDVLTINSLSLLCVRNSWGSGPLPRSNSNNSNSSSSASRDHLDASWTRW